MANPYIGQLLLAAWGITPRSYAPCNGQTMSINQNQALFSLLGTTFGGDGRSTFALPNLQGRSPMGASGQFPLGNSGGEASHLLTASEVPSHTHLLMAGGNAAQKTPAAALLAGNGAAIYTPAANLVAMNASSVSQAGGQPHENRQPYLVMNWLISLNGIYPSRN